MSRLIRAARDVAALFAAAAVIAGLLGIGSVLILRAFDPGSLSEAAGGPRIGKDQSRLPVGGDFFQGGWHEKGI